MRVSRNFKAAVMHASYFPGAGNKLVLRAIVVRKHSDMDIFKVRGCGQLMFGKAITKVIK